MKCPVCDSDRVVFMNNDLSDIEGKIYSHECLKCGAFFTRDEFNKSFKPGKEVLMEEGPIWERFPLSEESKKLRSKYLL